MAIDSAAFVKSEESSRSNSPALCSPLSQFSFLPRTRFITQLHYLCLRYSFSLPFQLHPSVRQLDYSPSTILVISRCGLTWFIRKGCLHSGHSFFQREQFSTQVLQKVCPQGKYLGSRMSPAQSGHCSYLASALFVTEAYSMSQSINECCHYSIAFSWLRWDLVTRLAREIYLLLQMLMAYDKDCSFLAYTLLESVCGYLFLLSLVSLYSSAAWLFYSYYEFLSSRCRLLSYIRYLKWEATFFLTSQGNFFHSRLISLSRASQLSWGLPASSSIILSLLQRRKCDCAEMKSLPAYLMPANKFRDVVRRGSINNFHLLSRISEIFIQNVFPWPGSISTAVPFYRQFEVLLIAQKHIRFPSPGVYTCQYFIPQLPSARNQNYLLARDKQLPPVNRLSNLSSVEIAPIGVVLNGKRGTSYQDSRIQEWLLVWIVSDFSQVYPNCRQGWKPIPNLRVYFPRFFTVAYILKLPSSRVQVSFRSKDQYQGGVVQNCTLWSSSRIVLGLVAQRPCRGIFLPSKKKPVYVGSKYLSKLGLRRPVQGNMMNEPAPSNLAEGTTVRTGSVAPASGRASSRDRRREFPEKDALALPQLMVIIGQNNSNSMFICSSLCGDIKDYQPEKTSYILQKSAFNEVIGKLDPEHVNAQDQSVVKAKLSAYETYLQECKDEGKKFVDYDFPPEKESIGSFNGKQEKIKWMRVTQLFAHPKLFYEDVSPDDVIQGSSGDCYFLSALASLAERPYQIKRIFGRHSTQLGIYTVMMRVKGVLTEVVIDDYVPVYNGNLVFAKPLSGSEEVWVLLVEKAWAKVHGNYRAITGGYPHTVLQSFCPGPSKYYNFTCDINNEKEVKEKQSLLIQQLGEASANNFPMCAGSKSSVELDKMGLVPGHTYSVVGVFDVKIKTEKKLHLVKLRNPWGSYQWNGRFFDKDDIWESIVEEEKKKIGYSVKNNGTFFMPLRQFIEYFESIDICKVVEGYNYNFNTFRVRTTKSSYFRMELDRQSKLNLSLFFENKESNKKAVILVAREIVHPSERNTYEYVCSMSEASFESAVISSGEVWAAGNYIIYVKIEKVDRTLEGKDQIIEQEVTLATYSPAFPTLFLVQKFKHNHPHFLHEVMLHRAKAHKKIIVSQPQLWYSDQFLMNEGDFGYIAAHSSPDSLKRLTFSFKEEDFARQKLVLKKPYKGKREQQDLVLHPGETILILCRLYGKVNELQFPPLTIKESV